VSLLSGPGSKFTKKWEVTFKKSTSKIVVFLMLGSVKLGREKMEAKFNQNTSFKSARI
jgi:hypothetical protein